MIIALSDGGLGLRMSGILPTLELRSRIKKVPFFIRPLVRRRAEAVTRERGLEEVTSQLLEKLKSRDHGPG